MNSVERLRAQLDTHNDERTLKRRTKAEVEAHLIATRAVYDLEIVWHHLKMLCDADFMYSSADLAQENMPNSFYNCLKRARIAVIEIREEKNRA